MKKIAILFLLVVSFKAFAQVSFEEGYFVKNSGEKVSCLIENIQWHDNPIMFNYKLHENDELRTASIENSKEFGIGEKLKFARFVVQIDRSTDDLQKMKYDRNPEFHEETLFLQVLVEGKASLYAYKDFNLKRYFFQTDSIRISQLVYKRYIGTKDKRSIAKDRLKKNERFKQQLWSALSCENVELKDVNSLNYTKTELVKFFKKYNECVNSNFTVFGSKETGIRLNWTIKAGITNSGITIQNEKDDSYNMNFDKSITGCFGLEAEMILPFDKNNWSFYVAPTYQSYIAEIDLIYVQTSTITKVMKVKAVYKSLEIPLGFRYSLISKDKSRLFFNTALVYDFPMNSSILGEREDLVDFEIIKSRHISFGLGYQYKNKYSIDFSYGLKKSFTSVANLTTEFESMSLKLGYKIF